jgi:chorismate mutase
MELLPIDKWGINKDGEPLGIMGPCSAETEEQMLSTAKELVHKNTHIFRAGVWKPRTRPNSFEGVGEIGLKWLSEVKKQTGMLVATEVASAEHVRLALKYGIDVLWIGARTSVNPFAVQEIADALYGRDKIVLVKNPINPDLELWIGALERLNQAGIKKLGAIHRGFSTYEKLNFRNAPKWQIPIELKRRYPDLPIICDPSHIGGSRELIYDISQTALNLEMDGLMIESHIDPDCALSDAKQQVTPDVAKKITEKLLLRNHKLKDSGRVNQLNNLRQQIDELDHQLISVFAQRMERVKDIGELKKEGNVAVLQTDRWSEIVEDRVNSGVGNGLSDIFIKKIFEAIHQESINKQNAIVK